ncbi:hypothetical protein GWK47_005971 [Chionoecetes opilio]|uniref:Uncharacterized protein n=1 Tax=Chionoecetes opilio TaxID=41210 RepID=A0A8J4Y7C9_CHIOP|nr:hypothetical protein GWK47_005971 [Chionoecetes opilio]
MDILTTDREIKARQDRKAKIRNVPRASQVPEDDVARKAKTERRDPCTRGALSLIREFLVFLLQPFIVGIDVRHCCEEWLVPLSCLQCLCGVVLAWRVRAGQGSLWPQVEHVE